MKKIILLLITITFTTNLFAMDTKLEDQRLCKVFEKKADIYKKNNRNDKYALKTLASYEKRAKEYCSQ